MFEISHQKLKVTKLNIGGSNFQATVFTYDTVEENRTTGEALSLLSCVVTMTAPNL